MGNWTWQEIYDMACRYAQYLISLDVRPGDLVAVYMMNSPEFMIWWLATFSLGCAPAMINYNLTGDALIHCLRISGAKVLLADEEEGCRQRVGETPIEPELGMHITILDEAKRAEIGALEPTEPEKWRRGGMKGSFPMVLSYTR
jgi:acyl-CoA synthetase (AMP-forming)/AMP-acid ligase II